jgi:hypothetical protein
MKTEQIKISEIVISAGTQIRAKVNRDAVDEYAEAMREGAQFPPVVVFNDGHRYILADGFHRVMAAGLLYLTEISAEIREGNRSDALKYALGANVSHGMRRTNADKHRSIALALSEWPKCSDREIARICAVSYEFVRYSRPQLSTVDSCPAQKRIGKDGKERRMPTRVSLPRLERKANSAPDHMPEPVTLSNAPVSIQTAFDELQHETSAAVIVQEDKPLAVEPSGEPMETVVAPGLAALRAEVREHLDLVFEDAKYVLEEWDSISLDRQALEDVARTQFFCAKMLNKLIKALAPTSNN